jgi:hypothetical protein
MVKKIRLTNPSKCKIYLTQPVPLPDLTSESILKIPMKQPKLSEACSSKKLKHT